MQAATPKHLFKLNPASGDRDEGRRGGGLLDAASKHNGFCKDTHPTDPTKHHSQGRVALFVVVIVVLCSISFHLIRIFLQLGGKTGTYIY